MSKKSILLLILFVLTGLTLFAQKRLNGKYDPVHHGFISNDTGIIIRDFVNGRAPFMIKGKNPFDYKTNRVGFIDTDGKVVIKPLYTNCSNFNGDFALVQDTTARTAMINKVGKIVIPFDRQNISLCENGLLVLATYTKISNISILNSQGKTIVPFGRYSQYATPPPARYFGEGDDVGHREFYWYQFRFDTSVYFKKYIGVKKDGKWAVINEQGKEVIPPKFDWIGIFNKEAAPIMIGKKYGVTDTAGKELVPAVYDNTILTYDNFVIATENKQTGVVSSQNKLLIPFKYDGISQINHNAFLADTGKNYNVRYGVINTNNKIIIPLNNVFIEKFGTGYLVHKGNNYIAVFDSIGTQKTDFVSGYRLTYPVWEMENGKNYIVYNEKKREFIHYEKVVNLMYYRDKKWGLLDSTGYEVTSPKYDFRNKLFTNGIEVKEKDKWGVISNKGKLLLQQEYDDIERLNDNLLIVKKNNKYGLVSEKFNIISPVKYDRIIIPYSSVNVTIQAMIDQKWACLDLNGKEITPFKYDEIKPIQSNFNLVRINKKYGLINSAGIELLPCIYDYIQLNSPPLIIVSNNGLYGLMNYDGKVVQAIVNNEIRLDMLDGKYVYDMTRQGKTGIVDHSGKQILPFLYEYVERIESSNTMKLFRVRNSKLYGVTDFSGKIIIPVIYERVELINQAFGTTNKYYSVTKNGKTGIIDDVGKQIIPCEYTRISGFQGKYLAASTNGRYGLISWSNKVVVPFIYDEIHNNGNNYVYTLDHKAGLLDSVGKVLISPRYDYIDQPFHNALFVHIGNKVGMIDEGGKTLLDPVYDHYSICGNETIQIEKNHLMGLIDYRGKVIYPCKYTYIKCANGKVVEIY
jgi:hypothetical protein